MASSTITLNIAIAFVGPHLKALAMVESGNNFEQLTRTPSSAPLEKTNFTSASTTLSILFGPGLLKKEVRGSIPATLRFLP